MKRLTEYHCGVAVIKDKQRISEALHKLAIYEDLEESDKRVQECVDELRKHRDAYMKKSTSWRIVNRAINLILGLGAEVEALRKREKEEIEFGK